ncbi:MAG: HAD hydrolase family protein [Acidimicrobiales bacterium]
MRFLRAVAIDFDGTLTSGGRPDEEVLAALARFRAAGGRIVLITGRIRSELLEVFGDVADHVDVLVTENGGVLSTPDLERVLAEPLPDELFAALADAGIAARRGQVLAACHARDSTRVLELTREIGVECQLVFNRGELMVLPPGISKATGVRLALDELELSVHNAVAIGDAENDHSLLHACEVGVAPANAVDSLKAAADLVLPLPDGRAVEALLRRVESREATLHSRRWRLDLGTYANGRPVRIPLAGTNVLLAGGTRSGKSFLAGLVAEDLIELGFRTLVVDPEGDHLGLRHLPGVRWLGGRDLPPSPTRLDALIGDRGESLVIDLSHLDLDGKVRWLRDLPEYVVTHRERTGHPHWVLLDEAHLALGSDEQAGRLLGDDQTQYCFVTYLPDLLPPLVRERIDTVVLVGTTLELSASIAGVVAPLLRLSPGDLARELDEATHGNAVLLRRGHRGRVSTFRIRGRHTKHVRHWHKYTERHLQTHQQFWFRRSHDEITGRTASNLAELYDELVACDAEVVAHHIAGGDFSRWIGGVIGDHALAAVVASAERAATRDDDPEEARRAIATAVHERYLED